MPDPVLFLPGFPRCPPAAPKRCANGDQFATAMPDVPLVSWRRLTERPFA